MPRSASGMASITGQVMRITPLTSEGAIDTTKPVHWTKGFISASFTPEFEDGEETNIKAADGSICVSWKLPDGFKRLTFNLSLCGVDPEVSKILAGGQLLVGKSSGNADPSVKDVVGYSYMSKILDNPVAIEIWATAVKDGKQAGYWHWVFPNVKVRYTGDREFSNGVLSNEFSGNANGGADALVSGGLNDALYGGSKLVFPSRAGGPEEQSYSTEHYAKALANPFSYVLADDTRIPAFVDANGDPCTSCTGAWLPFDDTQDIAAQWRDAGGIIYEGVGPSTSIPGKPTAVPATGATAGRPGVFTPQPAADAPADLAGLTGVTASPATAWTKGQYVVTADGKKAYWNGTAWALGAAP